MREPREAAADAPDPALHQPEPAAGEAAAGGEGDADGRGSQAEAAEDREHARQGAAFEVHPASSAGPDLLLVLPESGLAAVSDSEQAADGPLPCERRQEADNNEAFLVSVEGKRLPVQLVGGVPENAPDGEAKRRLPDAEARFPVRFLADEREETAADVHRAAIIV